MLGADTCALPLGGLSKRRDAHQQLMATTLLKLPSFQDHDMVWDVVVVMVRYAACFYACQQYCAMRSRSRGSLHQTTTAHTAGALTLHEGCCCRLLHWHHMLHAALQVPPDQQQLTTKQGPPTKPLYKFCSGRWKMKCCSPLLRRHYHTCAMLPAAAVLASANRANHPQSTLFSTCRCTRAGCA